jgi:hypothetical protein
MRTDKAGHSVDGGQTLIPRGNGTAARGFQVVEEPADHLWSHLFDDEAIDGGALGGRHKGQQ